MSLFVNFQFFEQNSIIIIIIIIEKKITSSLSLNIIIIYQLISEHCPISIPNENLWFAMVFSEYRNGI